MIQLSGLHTCVSAKPRLARPLSQVSSTSPDSQSALHRFKSMPWTLGVADLVPTVRVRIVGPGPGGLVVRLTQLVPQNLLSRMSAISYSS